jgi:hypothetical protein
MGLQAHNAETTHAGHKEPFNLKNFHDYHPNRKKEKSS